MAEHPHIGKAQTVGAKPAEDGHHVGSGIVHSSVQFTRGRRRPGRAQLSPGCRATLAVGVAQHPHIVQKGPG